ncbi:MAG: DMT family transporter [Syntrophobacteraceae bacterium]|nr:DMT family transporter [Desulfobacteraceae bacterium]
MQLCSLSTILRKHRRSGVFLAVAAAMLFGSSTPLAKILLGKVEPMLLAGLLYLGSGLGLGIWRVFWGRPQNGVNKEASLKAADLPWLAGAILAGGVAAPVLLMVGLKATSASSASLLLNLEGVFTAGLAWFAFKENFDRCLMLGMVAITSGCAVLSWSGEEPFFISWGSLAIICACFSWGIDNNLTRKVSEGDPVQIAAAKGLIAGVVNTGVALASSAALPSPFTLFASAFVGLLGYGISLVLFVLSLRHLGTARTGAYFSLAPFVGALIAVLALGEPVTLNFLAGAIFMGFGVWMHLTECHEHEHRHDTFEHEHSHVHDAHHRHHHEDLSPDDSAHSHLHAHCEVLHRHPHYPDIHHRHGH